MFGNCSTLDATCGTKFVQAFGRRAFRTTLAASDARVAAYLKLFMAGTSYSDGAQAVISAMLQSPYFLYRTELGTAVGQHLHADAVRGGDGAGLPADRHHARRHAAGRGRQRRRRQPDPARRWSTSRRRACSPRRPRRNATAVMGVHDRLARPRSPLHDRPRRHRLHDVEVGARRHGAGDAEPAPRGVQRQRQPRQRAHRGPHLPEQRARVVLRPADDGPQHRVQERVAGRRRRFAIRACSRTGRS